MKEQNSKIKKIKKWVKENKGIIIGSICGAVIGTGLLLIKSNESEDKNSSDILEAFNDSYNPDTDLLDPSLMTDDSRYVIMDADTGDLFKYNK